MMDSYWYGAFLQGIFTTIELTIVSLAIGFILAITMTYVQFKQIAILKNLVNALVYLIRGTPVLVQLFLVYYGLPEIPGIQDTLLWPLFKSPWFCAILTLSLNTGAYSYHLFYGALKNLPHHQTQSAKLLGMSKTQVFKHILLPQTLKNTWPAYQNEIFIIDE